MNIDTPFTIMCFSWNASGLKLCETTSQDRADASRRGFKGFITMKQQCLAPDFFEEIRAIIRVRRPSLLVMTTEDESSNGTYFHSSLLTTSMPEIGYSLLKRNKLNDIGELSSIQQMRVFTGPPSGSSLRVSIYALNELMPGLRMEEKLMSKFFSNDGQERSTCRQGDRISGAIASYVWHETFGKFVFISTHLPAGADSLNVGKNIDYASYRSAAKSANNLCLLSLINKFVVSLSAESKPDHIFLLGDLNYDIVIPNRTNAEIVLELANNVTALKMKDIQKYDELKKALEDVPLTGFKEGVSAEGPLFMPTWRLARGRSDECVPSQNTTRINASCFGRPDELLGGIGWHDRIIHKEMMTSNYMAHCIVYNRVDIKNMHASEHSGVIAFFEMRSVV